jgi:ribosomal protein S18 acetylase RimI-like enzyme
MSTPTEARPPAGGFADGPLDIRPMDEAAARVVVRWVYDPPYEIYTGDPEKFERDVRQTVDPANNIYAVYDRTGELTAYCSFGADARVEGGDYAQEALDLGLMIKPELTGLGRGREYAAAVIRRGLADYRPRMLRVTIAECNTRAIRVWSGSGFHAVQRFERAGDGLPFRIMVRDAEDAAPPAVPPDEAGKNGSAADRTACVGEGGGAGGETPMIRELTPDLLPDYLRFFDGEAFSDNPDWAGCYCYFHHAPHNLRNWEERTAAENRAAVSALIRSGRMSGYLAYRNGRPVGWCNAPRRSQVTTLAEEGDSQADDIGAIVCFIVAKPYRRRGVARALLDAACDGFQRRGLKAVEAYPNRNAREEAGNYHGTLSMFLRAGFIILSERANGTVVVRKILD